MKIYHKISHYYGVFIEGHTVFSGSYEACLAYIDLFTP